MGEPPSSPVGVIVVAADRQHSVVVDVDSAAALLASSLHDSGVAPGSEVGLAFVDVAEMTELNVAFMGGTGPTDVLAFPLDGAEAAPVDGPPAMVGDIIICPEVAARSVHESRTVADEVALLVVHGALHLVGHDHAEADEREVMQAREMVLLDAHYRAGTHPRDDRATSSGATP